MVSDLVCDPLWLPRARVTASVLTMTVTPLPSCAVATAPTAASAEEGQQQHPSWLYAGLLAGSLTDRTETSQDPTRSS